MADGYSPIPYASPAAYQTGSPYSALYGRSVGQNQADSVNQSQSTQQSQQQAQSDSFIPDFSQTPILEEIAKYAESMAPQVYDWGMQQFNKNQGNIDSMMRAGQEWASPAHIAAQMGQAEAGVQQAGEQGRQAALQDLQSYGIDPSAGRYAALDNASRVQTAAAAAGAGNQQRNADIAQGLTMQNQAMSAGLQNTQTGYGAANAMNSLLGTGMSLKYSPLGVSSSSSGTSSGVSSSSGSSASQGYNLGAMPTGGGGGSGVASTAGLLQSTADPVLPAAATSVAMMSNRLDISTAAQFGAASAKVAAGACGCKNRSVPKAAAVDRRTRRKIVPRPLAPRRRLPPLRPLPATGMICLCRKKALRRHHR
jgi:hypothetical protein